MPFYEHPDCIDNGLAYIKNNCNRIALISSYTVGDSYATVNGRILAEATMTSTDLVIGSSGNNRTLTVASKSDSSANASGGGADSHVALLDTVNSKVLYVTEESAAQSILVGNAVNIQGFVITKTQPNAA